jgi:hypothetical protein
LLWSVPVKLHDCNNKSGCGNIEAGEIKPHGLDNEANILIVNPITEDDPGNVRSLPNPDRDENSTRRGLTFVVTRNL